MDIATGQGIRLLSFSVQNITDAVFWFDQSGKVVWANDAACQSLAYPLNELLGLTATDFDPHYAEHITPQYWESIRESKAKVFESRHRTKDGYEFPVEIHDSFIDFEGTEYTCSIVRDLTDQKERERKLRLSDFTVEFAYNPIFWIDSTGVIRRVNDTACKRYGYTREEMTDMSIMQLNPTLDINSFTEQFRKMQAKKVNVFESIHRAKDGTDIPVEISMKHMTFEGEEFTCSFVVDLRDKKRTEQAFIAITEGTAATTGADFFVALAKSLTATLGIKYAFITEALNQNLTRLRTLAYMKNDQLLDNIIYDTEGMPCKEVVAGKMVYYPCDLEDIYPKKKGFQSYLGVPITDSKQQVIGNISVFDDVTYEDGERALPIMQVFATRAAAEIERLKNEESLRIALEEVERLRDRLAAENVYLQQEIAQGHDFDDIKTQSRAFIEVLKSIEQVARTEATVLLLGETGTGKELLARGVHSRSRRKDRPLVKVNCAALPENLIESELFGHEKGAFTGAIATKIGRFELADKGTLFLDEIGEMPVDLQAKLLRVLQEGELERLGSTTTKKVDVRIIAATNRNLEKEVEEGRFRADLYYRLNVFPISVLPLRERKEDIPMLVRHFIEKYGPRTGKVIEKIPKTTLDELATYDWPGNIRELENIIERAMILSPGKSLQLGNSLPKNNVFSTGENIPSIQENERDHIIKALELTGWRVSGQKGAAKILNIKPTTLEARMKKLGVFRP